MKQPYRNLDPRNVINITWLSRPRKCCKRSLEFHSAQPAPEPPTMDSLSLGWDQQGAAAQHQLTTVWRI